VPPVPGLSVGATIAYGAIGAIVAFILVQVLPWGQALLRGQQFSPTWPKTLGAVVVLVGFIVGGGFVALVVGGATEPRHAIAYGLAWQSIIGGLLQPPEGKGVPPPVSN